MMFMMPIPPTTSDTAATLASKYSMTVAVDEAALAMSARLRTMKVVLTADDAVARLEQRRDFRLNGARIRLVVTRNHQLVHERAAGQALQRGAVRER